MTMEPADSNPVAPNPLFRVVAPVNVLKPADQPDDSSEIAAAFANAAAAFMRIAELLSGGQKSGSLNRIADLRGSLSAPEIYGVSVFEACNEFLVSRARKGVSAKYYRQLKSVLESFCENRARQALADVDLQAVEHWLNKRTWSVRTRKNNLATLRLLIGWAMRRDWLKRDVTSGIELGENISPPISIHTPEQVATVLETARGIDLGVMRLLAIRYFAGVRSAEAFRLREENILLAHGIIEIPALKSKTKRRRIVKICPNLRAWLDLGGVLIPTGEMTVRRVIFQSGVKWAHNVTRHTWESYSVALHENRAKVAKEAGHSEAVQIANYDAVALPADAAAFFEIRPEPLPRDLKLKRWGGLRRAARLSEGLPQSNNSSPRQCA
jgi:integrase